MHSIQKLALDIQREKQKDRERVFLRSVCSVGRFDLRQDPVGVES